MDNDNGIKEKAPNFERISFDGGFPCRLRKRVCTVGEFSALHYASTLEIIIVDGAQGIMSIDNVQYTAQKRDVFVIPPHTIHASAFRPGEGCVYVFKISFEHLSQYINTDNLFSARGHSLSDVPHRPSQYYNEICDIILKRISYQKNELLKAIEGIVKLFRILDESIEQNSSHEKNQKAEQRIFEIMQWTSEHVTERITIEEAAAAAHYSKYYFCRFFKENTGVTYLHYLQSLKIDHAIKLMKEGHSTTYCCYECGFDNLSYFVKLFKEITGSTTTEYRKKLLEENP